MAPTFKRVVPAPVTPTGQVQIAPMKSVQWTAAHTVCAWVAHVAVRKAGQAQLATREPAIPAAQSTAPVKMGSVNVARDGTESTVPLRAALACATAMGGAHWTKTAGIVSASQDGGEQAVTWPWKLFALTVRTTKEMGWLTVWILTAVCRVLAKTSLIVVDYLIPKILSAKANSLHLSKLPKHFMTGSVFSLEQTALMSYLGKVLLTKVLHPS